MIFSCPNLKFLIIVTSVALITITLSHRMDKRSAMIGSSMSRHYLKRILWNKTRLSYSLHGNVAAYNQTSYLSVNQVLRASFDEWQANSCFRFYQINNDLKNKSDIKIIFTRDGSTRLRKLNYAKDRDEEHVKHERCERRFRGSAAHAFFKNHKKYPANIHVNNEFFWMESRPPTGTVSLRTVLLHEIGHVLGLFHNADDSNSVMYEFIFTNQVKSLNENDKMNIKTLYSFLCKKYYN